jgi:molecular chaperone DnaK
VLPEPHAAALAYAVENAGTIQDRHILVYDLGGGTFDVTMIHATTASASGASLDLNISTLCKDGNRHLGGLDWDRALARLVIDKVLKQHSEDISNDADNEPLLLDNCEKAKRHLSRTGSVSIIADSKQHQVDVTAEEFESQTADLLYQTQALLEHVIEEAEKSHGVAKDQIEVMLTGGASRMPMVARLIESALGRPPLRYQNPELLVTIGAAYRAHLLGEKGAGRESPGIMQTVREADGTTTKKEVRVGGLSDIGRPVGVEVLRAGVPANAVVVPDGSSYGQEFEKIFSTTEDGMTEIDVVLHEGSSAKLEECRKLKTFTITGLPANRPKGRPVKIIMGYDNSGIVRGKAIDVETGVEVPIEVTPGF